MAHLRSAFATIYGEARLAHIEVWAYQVNPQHMSASVHLFIKAQTPKALWHAGIRGDIGFSIRPHVSLLLVNGIDETGVV